MSTIAAGTTSGTALVSTGDTTGTLILQTNGTTTAVTIGTNQVVTLAQPLPVASGGTGGSATPTAGGIVYGTGTVQAVTAAGTSGQYLKSNGASAPTWVTPSNDFVFLSTVNATSATTVTISITGTYSSYLLTGYKIGSDAAPTTVDLVTSTFDEEGWYNNAGTWSQTSNVLNNIGGSSGGSSFEIIFNGLTDTNSNTKIGTGTGYGYYSGPHLITLNKANNTGISSIVFTLSGGATFNNGVFNLYGIT